MANSKRMYSKLKKYKNGFIEQGSEKDRVNYKKSKEHEKNITSIGNSIRST